MSFYYPIPAGALVTCMGCHAMLVRHFDERGGWRGCPADQSEPIPNDHPVFLVSTQRRASVDRRVNPDASRDGDRQRERAAYAPAVAAPPVLPSMPPRAIPAMVPLAAGPRGAVYMAAPGVPFRGGPGQMAAVYDKIAGSREGKTMAELRKELKMKQKSLESVLYRLKLQGTIQAYPIAAVRG